MVASFISMVILCTCDVLTSVLTSGYVRNNRCDKFWSSENYTSTNSSVVFHKYVHRMEIKHLELNRTRVERGAAMGKGKVESKQFGPPGKGGWCDTNEAVYKPWFSLEVTIPENEATDCMLSSMQDSQ